MQIVQYLPAGILALLLLALFPATVYSLAEQIREGDEADLMAALEQGDGVLMPEKSEQQRTYEKWLAEQECGDVYYICPH